MQFLQTRHDARHRPNYPTRKSTSNLKAARERANLVEEGSASDGESCHALVAKKDGELRRGHCFAFC